MKIHCTLCGLTATLILLLSTTHAAIWYVHPDSTMNCIQDCLDSCSMGDTVLVGPGTYQENISWPSTQSILLRSEYGPDTTIIDGGHSAQRDSGSVVLFMSGEDSTAVLDGFTLKNGTGTYVPPYGTAGGGIYCLNYSSPTICNNIITENEADYAGGIDVHNNCSPTIIGNIITFNNADSASGGIQCFGYCSPLISDNVIYGNTGYNGGGIQCDNSAPTISYNTIDSNFSYWGGGIVCDYSSPLITNNSIIRNTATWGGGIECWGVTASPTIKHNSITDNVASYGGGVTCNNSSVPSIDSCTISYNEGDGIYCEGGSDPIVHYNNICDNIGYALRNTTMAVIVDAENNWWGHPSGPSGFGPGSGDTVSNYIDYDPWLTDSVQGIGIEELELLHPVSVTLQANPNPFRHLTDIRYQITDDCNEIVLTVYDIAGRKVKDLTEKFSVISHKASVKWNGTDNLNRKLPSGVYFLQLQAGDYSATKKLLLIR